MHLREFTTRANRSLCRRLNRQKPIDSFPYLSGDSYFFSCEYFYENRDLRRVPQIPLRVQKANSVFAKIGDLSSFIHFLRQDIETDFTKFSLVLHNGDESIPEDCQTYLSSRFNKIFSVNLLHPKEKYFPIPIGLENAKLFTNGVTSDFKKLQGPGLIENEARRILLLDSFSTLTNPVERMKCHEIAIKLDAKVIQGAETAVYREMLVQSRFVLSPAGNGFDCHRTWESLYLGSIPILRRAHWPFSAYNLPVLLIDEWDDLLELDLESVQVPWNPYWSQEFWNDFYNA